MMDEHPMMECGHAANATRTIDGEQFPACVICAGKPEADRVAVNPPDLTGRRARCSYFDPALGSCPKRPNDERHAGGSERASDPGLPFFEYLGRGSRHATKTCECGYFEVAHMNPNPLTGRPGIATHKFEPVGAAEFDRFYCGCWGWD